MSFNAKCTDSDLSRTSAESHLGLCSYILQYPMILLADSEGSDQTVQMRRLILAFAVRGRLKTHFRMAWSLSYLHFSASLQQSNIPAEINKSAFKMSNANINNYNKV